MAWCALTDCSFGPPRARLRVNDTGAQPNVAHAFRWTLFIWYRCKRCGNTRTMELDFSDWRQIVTADVWDDQPIPESEKTHAGMFQA